MKGIFFNIHNQYLCSMKLSTLFGKSTNSDWNTISTLEELDKIKDASFTKPQIIFKHSTRCSISMMAKSRLEKGLQDISALSDVYYLDLLSFRNISNEVATRFNIEHESPQIIILKNGTPIYDASHNMIIVEDIMTKLK